MKAVIKKISVFAILSVILNIFAAYGVGAEGVSPYDGFAQLTGYVPIDDLYPGDEVYLIYRLEEKLPAYGAEINISYNSDMLSFKKAESLTGIAEVKEVLQDSKSGSLTYAYTLTGKILPEVRKDIVRITFTALKSGTSKVLLNSSALVLVNDDKLEYVRQTDSADTNIVIKSHDPQPTSKPSYSGGGGGGGGTFTKPKPSETPVPTESTEPIPTPKPTENPGTKDEVFTDVGAVEWAKNAITELNKKGIISGYDGKFFPNDLITRAEVSKILCNVFELKNIDGKSITFTDVDENAWYADCVTIMFQNGLLSGESAEKCMPERNITREEFAALVGRSLSVNGFSFTDNSDNTDKKTFADENKTSDFAKPYIEILSSAGIINGYGDNTFRPKENLSRAEAAVMIHRLVSYTDRQNNPDKTEDNSL